MILEQGTRNKEQRTKSKDTSKRRQSFERFFGIEDDRPQTTDVKILRTID